MRRPHHCRLAPRSAAVLAAIATGVGLTAVAAAAAAPPIAAPMPAGGVDPEAADDAVRLLATATPAAVDAAVPSPAAFLGRTIGVGAVSPVEVGAYLAALAAASDAVTVTEYARSHEGRPLVYVTITSPANHARLDELRERHADFVDPRRVPAARRTLREFDAAAEDLPGVAWLAASIHGDEMSGTDAVLLLAWRLAAGTDEATRRMRDELIVHIDPLQNPDGRARFLAQVESMSGLVPNPDHAALHHTGDWSGGRTNHYRFDLNRDWVPMVHPETRGRARAITAWNPMLLVDAHEMGSLDTYLFDPPREPIHPAQSRRVREWRDRFGADQAEAFDARGWAYYTQEWYEEWYPGYTNAWASLGGAIGLLYEQASINGSLVRKPSGRIETFADAVEHQLVSFIANLDSLQTNREAILRDRIRDQMAAVGLDTNAARGDLPAGVLLIPPHDDIVRLDRLAELLSLQGIEVSRTGRDLRAVGLRTWTGHREDARTLPAGTLVVRSEQPRRRLLHALCGFDPRMTEEFLLKERQELARGRGSLLYDVTAWNLPMAAGLPAYWADGLEGAAGGLVTWTPQAARGAAAIPDAPRVGWIVDGGPADTPRLLVRLLDAGLVVRTSTRPFSLAGERHPAGSLLIRRSEQDAAPADVAATIRTAADGLAVAVIGAEGGLTDDGVDLGGQRFDVVRAPRVAIAGQWPVDPNGFGSVWHAIDARLGLRASVIAARDLGRLDLRRYSVLVLPDGGGLGRALGAGAAERLRDWVAAGGTLIAIDGAADWASDPDVGLGRAQRRAAVLGELETWQSDIERERRAWRDPFEFDAVWGGTPGSPDRTAPPLPAGMRDETPTGRAADADGDAPPPPAVGTAASLPKDDEERTRLDDWQRRFSPTGAFLLGEVDPDHWIGYGVDERLPILVSGGRVFLSREPSQTPVRLGAADSLRLSGLLWPEARVRLHRASIVTVDRVGRGQVICFAVDPVFRGMTDGTRRLLENALLLGPSLGASGPVPW
jgi:hypothetical protein